MFLLILKLCGLTAILLAALSPSNPPPTQPDTSPKKLTGPAAEGHYQSADLSTGEVFELPPEKSVCVSRRPGIGRDWYERHGKYLRDHDHAIIRGKKVRPAKYYDRLFDLADPEAFRAVKSRRKNSGENSKIKLDQERKAAYDEYISIHGPDSFPLNRDRLYVMEDYHEAQAKILKRGLENGET